MFTRCSAQRIRKIFEVRHIRGATPPHACVLHKTESTTDQFMNTSIGLQLFMLAGWWLPNAFLA
jgi:hypothetical protein